MIKNLCYIFAILLSACANSDMKKSASVDDICGVVESVINLGQLQQYYHVDTFPERVPLNIRVHLPESISMRDCTILEKFGQPVIITSDKKPPKASGAMGMIFRINDLEEGSMSVNFNYMPEGIKGEVKLLNIESLWTIKESKIIEI